MAKQAELSLEEREEKEYHERAMREQEEAAASTSVPEVVESEGRELAVQEPDEPDVPVRGGMQIGRAELVARMDLSRRYPRNVKSFLNQSMTLACADRDVAALMYYSLPRGGKKIEGPSVRLAEVMASAWGHIMTGGRISEIGEDYVEVIGWCCDCSSAVSFEAPVRRPIVYGPTHKYKAGQRYDTDMINVTANAAISIAIRNAILRVIPRAYADMVYRKAKATALDQSKPLDVRRKEVMAALMLELENRGKKAKESDILKALGCESMADASWSTVQDIIGLTTAIMDGEINPDNIVEAASKTQSGMQLPGRA